MVAETNRPHPVVDELMRVVGPEGVLVDRDELLVYECDGFPIARGLPLAVVFPRSTQETAACVRAVAGQGLQIVPRGSGTGLAGGCVAFGNGVIVSTARMTRIEAIDVRNRVAVAQAGVRNLALSEAVAAACATEGLPAPLHFSPDPSSQAASTVGGNAATCAGGLTTLKYGVTTQHILGMEVVLGDGSVAVTRGGGLYDGVGPDLPALLCGSEGTLGLITRVWCRLTPKPQHFRTVVAVFDSTADACTTVSDIIASGLVPAAMEIMDDAMIQAVEAAFHYGFPTAAQALLLVELHDLEPVLEGQLEQVVAIARGHAAQNIRHCAGAEERTQLWSARKKAFGAIGRISPGYCTQDACIPRSRLPEAVPHIVEMGARAGLRICNVFHAGDGNVHPIFLFDEDDPAEVQKVLRVAEDVLEYCLGLGGTITGEHGVGVEKLHLMERMFDPATIGAFRRIKAGLDPQRVVNEGKLIPSDRVRIELLAPAAPNQPGGAL